MSIATITTFGFGSYSTVNLSITMGYSTQSSPPPPSNVYIQKMGGHQRVGFPLGFASIILLLVTCIYE